MQEEIEEKTVRLAISGTRLTGMAVAAAIRTYLRHRANEKLASIDEHIQGKQSIDELVKQNQGVSSMVVGDAGIRTFERIAKKYGVDFAIMKDKSEKPPVYTAFFKERDTDAMEAVMDGDKCILQLRGVRPFLSDKYDVTRHPLYKETGEYDDRNKMDIQKYVHQSLKVKKGEMFDVVRV